MKLKNKGKVYPSPSPSSSSLSLDYVPGGDFLSVLNLLPAAIFALASVLSLEDREVLAYLIARSLKSATPSSPTPESKKKSSKRTMGGGCGSGSGHNPPIFGCECFDCYRSYWFRWDSSVNRELIHQAIEAFEDQLASGEKSKNSSGRNRRRDRTVRRDPERPASIQNQDNRENDESSVTPLPSVAKISSPSPFSKENAKGSDTRNTSEKVEEATPAEEVIQELSEEEGDGSDIVPPSSPTPNNKQGISARKVLPDVLGLFNSRLWSLWSPHV